MAPGDTLVITCERALTRQQVQKIKAGVLDDLPAGCKVIVLHSGLRVGAMAQARRVPIIPQPQSGRTAIRCPPPPPPTRIVTDGVHPASQDQYNRKHRLGAHDPRYMAKVDPFDEVGAQGR